MFFGIKNIAINSCPVLQMHMGGNFSREFLPWQGISGPGTVLSSTFLDCVKLFSSVFEPVYIASDSNLELC